MKWMPVPLWIAVSAMRPRAPCSSSAWAAANDPPQKVKPRIKSRWWWPEVCHSKREKGAVAKKGKQATFTTPDDAEHGKKFDSSVVTGAPFTFALGAGQVLPGWIRVCRGFEERREAPVVSPASLGYGTAARGSSPRNAT